MIVDPKIDQVQTAKKVTKIILRITAKHYAYLKTLTKTSVKLQKDPGNIVYSEYTLSLRFGRGLMSQTAKK